MTAAVPPGRSPVDAPGPSRLAFHSARIGLAAAVAVLTFVLFPSSPAIDFPIYEVGSVASDNVIAPFAFRVLKTPAELEAEQNAVVRAVEPVFDYRPAALDSARQTLNGFAAALAQAANTTPDQASVAVQRAASSWGVRLTANQAAYLAVPRRTAAAVRQRCDVRHAGEPRAARPPRSGVGRR